MEAARSSEKSDNFFETTRSNVPEHSHLHIRRLEYLKPKVLPEMSPPFVAHREYGHESLTILIAFGKECKL
jgi:hypothetical protein